MSEDESKTKCYLCLPAFNYGPLVCSADWAAGIALLALLSTACAPYADFALPPAAGGDPAVTFRFEPQPDPVIARGQFADALNPSVSGAFNLYSVFDGKTWHTALATSPDGRQWSPQGIVLSPDPRTWEGGYIAANGALLQHGGQLWYWYQAAPRGEHRIGLAHSDRRPNLAQGIPRSRSSSTVPLGAWDERVAADPYVIRIDPYFYLYYLGQDQRRTRQRLGAIAPFHSMASTGKSSAPTRSSNSAGSDSCL